MIDGIFSMDTLSDCDMRIGRDHRMFGMESTGGRWAVTTRTSHLA
jgi:hypothetical protein